MSKEIQIETGVKIRDHYKCEVVIDEIREPHVLFNLNDIGKLLQLSNIRSNTRSEDKINLKRKTNGGEQFKSFINYKVLCKLLTKCRKPAAIDVCAMLNFDVNTVIYSCVEADTLKCIIEAFNGEQMIAQHKFGKYMVDLYMPLYNIIIECDESQHMNNVESDVYRENVIKDLCPDCVFVRYDPTSKQFNIFKVINRIYNTIKSSNISRNFR
jgi:very-short-patch-repair endonuclease